MWRDDAYLLDMLLAAREAADIAAGLNEQSFRESLVHQNAIAYVLQKVGEAASHVSSEGRAKHGTLDWPNIINLRHRLVHDYKNINMATVWMIVTTEVPAMIRYLEAVVPPDEES